jgi:cysteine desulfurase family protein
MIYFDNAATTFPKPLSVKKAAENAIENFGGNPGRSGHKMSLRVAGEIYKTRQLVADFFDAETENVVFTQNCTHALNLAIKGIMQEGDHIIISSLEHNSVSRPVYALAKKSCTFSIAEIDENDDVTIRNFERLITNNTKAIACTIASNVTGQILPFRKIAQLCKKYNICYIADGAQACGVIPLKMSDGFNFLCAAGHKGLYGSTGTGLLISDGKYNFSTIMEGGTGTTSDQLEQPDFVPERYECGTLNTVGIITLRSGIDFLNKTSIQRIHQHEMNLCNLFIEKASKIKGIKIYRKNNCQYVPIVSFNIEGLSAEKLASLLDKEGFALRGGLHCAILAHNSNGTDDTGTVRFSPSAFNNSQEVLLLIKSLKKISINL